MPDPNLSAAIMEAYASAPDTEVILHTLELRHPAFTSPIRVVRDNVDHTLTLEASAPVEPSTAVLFVGYAFDLKPPDVAPQGVPEILITIDNVTREIEDQLVLAAVGTTQIDVTYRQYLASDTTGPQNNPPMTMTLIHAKVSMMQVTGRATFVDISNKRFPAEDYDSVRFPGLVL